MKTGNLECLEEAKDIARKQLKKIVFVSDQDADDFIEALLGAARIGALCDMEAIMRRSERES